MFIKTLQLHIRQRPLTPGSSQHALHTIQPIQYDFSLSMPIILTEDTFFSNWHKYGSSKLIQSIRNKITNKYGVRYQKNVIVGKIRANTSNHTQSTNLIPDMNPLKPCGHCMYRTVVTVCTAQWSVYVPHSGHCMYRQINIQQFCVLSTQCVYVFCVDLRTNSDYFPTQH